MRDGSVKDEDGVLAFVNDDVGGLMASTGGDFDGQRDDRVGDVVDPMSTTSAVLSCQPRLPICCSLAFWVLVRDSFVVSFWIASSDCVSKAISVKPVYGFETKYFLRLWQMDGLTTSMETFSREDSSKTSASLHDLAYKLSACRIVVMLAG